MFRKNVGDKAKRGNEAFPLLSPKVPLIGYFSLPNMFLFRRNGLQRGERIRYPQRVPFRFADVMVCHDLGLFNTGILMLERTNRLTKCASVSFTPGMTGQRNHTCACASSRAARDSRIGASGAPAHFLRASGSLCLKSNRKRSVSGISSFKCAAEIKPFVSSAVWYLYSRQAVSSFFRSSKCKEASPPEKVTPPFDER